MLGSDPAGVRPQPFGVRSRRGARAAAPALQRHARDPDPGRHRVRAPADDGDPGAAGTPARAAHHHDVGHLGADGLPARCIRRNARPRQARGPVREGTSARGQPRSLPARLGRRGARLEHLGADRRTCDPGRRRRGVPAQLRDHQGRVPAREDRRRDRARVRGLRRRRRFRIVLSGLIVDNASWRWLFIVGAVAIAAAVVLVHRYVPESPIRTPSRVDFFGATLLSGGLISMLLALTEGEDWGWTSGRILGLAAAAAFLLVAWGLAELRVPEPMVDMRMLAIRQVLLTNLTALVAGFAMFGSFVLVPNFVEIPHGLSHSVQRLVNFGFDASATKAGLYLLPSSFTLLFAGPLAGLIGRRSGSKWPLAAGLLLVAAAAGWLAIWHDESWQILAAMAVLGAGVGFAYAAMATL